MAKKKFPEYFLGLDIGTNSVGWSVTDLNYNVLKFNGKSMWGVRLFDEANTAAERRSFRASRRRLQRRKDRLALLEEIFAEEISKVDMGFFQRLRESQFHIEDKQEFQKNSIFNDKDYKDSDYHKEYPTIHHLINRIVMDPSPVDIRLLFLAISYTLKYRGHFLFEGQKFDTEGSFELHFNNLKQILYDELEIDLEGDIKKFKEILTNGNYGIQKKSSEINLIFGLKTKPEKEISKLLSGGKGKLINIFESEETEDWEIKDIQFSESSFEDNFEKLELQLGEKAIIIDFLKKIYDWAVLAELLDMADETKDGKRYLSSAKIKIYKEHKDDLATLKKVVKNLINKNKLNKESYDEIFRLTEESKKEQLHNYPAYTNSTIVNNNRSKPGGKVSQEEFCDFLKKNYFSEDLSEDLEYQSLYKKVIDKTLMPKQIDSSNGVIPYQLKLIELEKMLENAEKYAPFLLRKDASGISASQKIKMIMTYRIPYYVGPVNPAHVDGVKSWVERKMQNTRVTPWNFEQVIDVEKTAENFITTRTNKCTYLTKEDVLPKDSLLYSEFMVLNELNNLRINGILIDTKTKELIFEKLFKVKRKVTIKDVTSLLISNGIIDKGTVISGIDCDFKTSFKSYLDFKAIFGDEIEKESTQVMIEAIIKYLVLFGDEKKLTRKRIEGLYGEQVKDKLDKILKLKYREWGRLSGKLLTEVFHVDRSTGEILNIVSMMRNESLNLMEILSQQYSFSNAINEENSGHNTIDNISYDVLDELYLSPSVKRMLWQSLTIVEELRNIIGDNPKKIFIEMARAEEEKPTRKDSRKKALSEMYKALGKEFESMKMQIEKTEERQFRSDTLYLYYTQLGRCMYSGDSIEMENLFNRNIYDIDHIIPKSKILDDSLDNRVLTKKALNSKKLDKYPIDKEFRQENLWYGLEQKGLISHKKLEKLLRTTELTADELAGFIARQIVETRQATKATADVLKKVFESDIKKGNRDDLTKTEVVYVKAGNVSRFRQKFDIPKVREINDLHHAHDAYLNIVVGNVFHTKFTSNPWNFMKERNSRSYNIQRIYDKEVTRNGLVSWSPNYTIINIKNSLKNTNIQVNRYSYVKSSGFYAQNLLRKNNGTVPIKSGSKFSDLNKYGGYSDVRSSYIVLIETEENNKKRKLLEFVPTYLVYGIKDEAKKEKIIIDYFIEQYKVNSVKVVVNRIKLYSTAIVDGYKYTINGKADAKRLSVSPFIQLILDWNYIKYIKNLLNFKNKKSKNKEILIDGTFDKISIEENIKLYNVLVNKMNSTIFQYRKNNQKEMIASSLIKFSELSIEDQVVQLLEIIKILTSQNDTADLSLLGGSKNACKVLINRDLNSYKQFVLINQSPTGLFEEKIDLLTL